MPKVMLIEDDETMLDLLQTLLEFEGFQVAQLNGNDDLDGVLNTIRREKPALVLTDIHLQHFNGFDLLRRIRKDKDLASVLILMSSGMELDHQCRQEGADGFILKPYMPDDLIRKIRHTLEN